MLNPKYVLVQLKISHNFRDWIKEQVASNPEIRNQKEYFLRLCMRQGYKPVEEDFPQGTTFAFMKDVLGEMQANKEDEKKS